MDPRLSPDPVDSIDANDPMLPSEPTEPMLAIEPIDPMLPMDRIEWRDAIDRIDPVDRSDRIEVRGSGSGCAVMGRAYVRPVRCGVHRVDVEGQLSTARPR